MGDGNDCVRPFRRQLVDLALCGLNLVPKLYARDPRRIGRGRGACGGQAEKADLFAVPLNHCMAAVTVSAGKQGNSILVHIRRKDGEFRPLDIVEKPLSTIIKLVVARRHHVVTGGVHRFNNVRALCQRGIRESLRRIAGVNKYGVFRLLFHRRHPVKPYAAVFHPGGCAVNVVGVVDYDLPLARFGGKAGHAAGQDEDKRNPNCDKFFDVVFMHSFHLFKISHAFWFCCRSFSPSHFHWLVGLLIVRTTLFYSCSSGLVNVLLSAPRRLFP